MRKRRGDTRIAARGATAKLAWDACVWSARFHRGVGRRARTLGVRKVHLDNTRVCTDYLERLGAERDARVGDIG